MDLQPASTPPTCPHRVRAGLPSQDALHAPVQPLSQAGRRRMPNSTLTYEPVTILDRAVGAYIALL